MHLEARVRRAILAAAAFVTLGVSANGVADVASADSAIPSTSSLHVAVKTPTAPRSPAATAGNAKVTLTWAGAVQQRRGVGLHRAGQRHPLLLPRRRPQRRRPWASNGVHRQMTAARRSSTT
jgi:hypothetical protein